MSSLLGALCLLLLIGLVGIFFSWVEDSPRRKLRKHPISIHSVVAPSPAKVRKLYNFDCNICGANPATPNHGCFAKPTIRRTSKSFKQSGYYERYKYVRTYQAQIIDRYGVVWECSHRHENDRGSAFACALKHFTDHIEAKCKCIPILGFSAVLVPSRRMPIPNLNENVWNSIKQKQNFVCFYCKTPARRFEKEHVIPLSRGGLNSIENIVAACSPCNRHKGSMTGEEWQRIVHELKNSNRWPPTNSWETSRDIRKES